MEHSLHLLFTVLSFGLWGLGWLVCWIMHHRKPWRCGHCGRRYRKGAERAGKIARATSLHVASSVPLEETLIESHQKLV